MTDPLIPEALPDERGPLPCEACDGEGEWFRYEGEGDAHTVPCNICDGTGRDQFASKGAPDA